MDNKNKGARIILLLGVAIVCSMLARYLPVLGMLFFWVGACFASISYLSESNINIALAITLYTFAQYFMVGSVDFAVIESMVLVLPAVILGRSMRNKELDDSGYLIATIVMAIVVMFIFKQLNSQHNLWDMFEKSFEDAMTQFKNANIMYKLPDNISASNIISTMKNIFPATIIITSLIYVILSKYMALSIITSQMKVEEIDIKPFNQFIVSSKLGFLFMIFYLVANMMKFMGGMSETYLSTVITNIVYIMSYVVMIQGIAVIMYFVRNVRSKFLKNFVLMIVCIISLSASIPMILLGMTDMLFDFRKLGFRRRLR